MQAAFRVAVAVAVLTTAATPAGAQLFYAGIRGGAGIPTGPFAEKTTATGNDALLRNATPGFGYGLDAGIGSPLLGLYAGYDRIRFGCASGTCATSGKYELTGISAGVRASVPLLPLIKPWAKAGITYNEMKGSFPGASSGMSVSTGKGLGYEVGAGVDIPMFLGLFSLTPQVRRVRQNLEPRLSPSTGTSAGKRPADYYTFDIGLRVRSPL